MGKPYTMKEMRAIVEYVNERKAYNETKGKKMWVEFANSNKTDRTWQSSKETFLKRILPDIHNPYYKLTRDQVRSFKEGEDVTEREKIKLEIRMYKNSNGVSRSSPYLYKIINKKLNILELNKGEVETILKDWLQSLSYDDTENLLIILNDDQNELSTANKDSEMPTRCHENEGQTKCKEELTITNLDEELEKVTGENNADKTPSCRASLGNVGMKNNEMDTETTKISTDHQIKSDKPQSNKNLNSCEKNETNIHGNETLRSNDGITNTESTTAIAMVESNSSGKSTVTAKINTDCNKTIIASTEGSTQSATFDLINLDEGLEKVTGENNADKTSSCRDSSGSIGMKNNGMDSETTEILTDHQTKSDKPQNNKNLNSCAINKTNIRGNETLQPNDGITNTKSTTAIVMVESNSSGKSTGTAKIDKDCKNTIIASTEGSTQSATFDLLLPCNQEALEHRKEEHNAKHDKNGGITNEITRKEKRPSIKINENRKERESSIGSNEIDGECTVEIHDSCSPHLDTKSLTMNTPFNKMRHDNPTTNNTEEQSSVKQLLDNERSRKVDEDDLNTKVNARKDTTVVRKENLCLQNVNLFNEQSRNQNYSDSSSDDANTQQVQNRVERSNSDAANIQKVQKRVDRKKYSGTSIQKRNVDTTQATDKPNKNYMPQQNERNNGGVRTNRKRRMSHRRRSHHRRRYHSHDTGSYSSEWSSESDCDSYVSPPRGSRSRHTKQFMRPKPSYVLEVPEEGKLYVLFGKRAIYPVVKKRKHSKNFVRYNPDSDSEQEESTWKEKCLIYERVIKDLTKKLGEGTSERPSEPLRAQNGPNTGASERAVAIENNITKIPDVNHKLEEKKDEVTYKIVDQKGCEHVFIGPCNKIKDIAWDLKKTVQNTVEVIAKEHVDGDVKQTSADVHHETSRTPTPANSADMDVVRETVNRKENEIFSVIEKMHTPETDGVNVTKRRGRPRKIQSLQPPIKMARSSKSTDSKPETKTRSGSSKSKSMDPSKQSNSVKILAVGTRTSSRVLKTPKKFEREPPQSDIKLRTGNELESSPPAEDEEQLRYKFPSLKDKKKYNMNRSLPVLNIIPPQDRVENWVDTTFGYQDSDDSVMKISLPPRKRKCSFKIRNEHKTRRLKRRTSCPMLVAVPTDSNSSYFVPLRRSVSSLNSEHITDSYRLLMPKQNHSSRKLESIDENDTEPRYFRSVSKDTNELVDLGSSSNVSLPCSPELSVVENMSISREIIKNATHPTINEVQQNVYSQAMDYSEYVISNVDLSVPLMEQKCMLQKNSDRATSTQNISNSINQMKDCTVDITMSDTLDRRLRALLLESAKKPNPPDKPTPMETDESLVTTKKTRTRNQKENKSTDADNPKKNIKTKKRSSTPQKKKTIPKSKAPQNPIIEEEHTVACASGRKSCPPYLTFMPIEEYALNNNDDNVEVNSKKKDIIKVKIIKPKGRSKTRSSENLRGKSVGNGSVASIYSDSINSKYLSLTRTDSTVDLIHNHSETCLETRECMESDGVECIRNSRSVSLVDLVSSSQHSSQENLILSEDNSNNRDNDVSERRLEPLLQSPVSNSSLITEDLSDTLLSQPTKWYLLDEDITNVESPSTKQSSYGSNLVQIFPIACAVPDLSTISEVSRENEDSRKTGDLQQRLRDL